MDHMQYLLVRSHNPEEAFHHPLENADDGDHEHMSGHALMASAPPHSQIMNKPKEHYEFPDPGAVAKGQVQGGLGLDGLAKLLDLSNRLPFDHYTEITPVMAWTTVLRHPRLGELAPEDFESIKSDLSSKVRCYGFGAVLEEFELQDALGAVLAKKEGGPALMITEVNMAMSSHQITARAR